MLRLIVPVMLIVASLYVGWTAWEMRRYCPLSASGLKFDLTRND